MTGFGHSIAEPNGVDFFSPELLASPYGFLKKARQHAPVVRVKTSPVQRVQYLVTTYDLVQYVLTNPQLFSSNYQAILTSGGREDPEVEAIRAQGFKEVSSVLTADDSDHRRLRGLIATAFAPARLRAMNEKLEQVVNERIDVFIERGRCNFMAEFADWLPSAALASLMGLDSSRNDQMQAWALAITRRFGGMGTLDERISDERAILDAKRFLVDLVEERRRRPGSDLVSDIIQARDEDQSRLSELEIFATIFILLVGATETTFNTLNFAMVHLLENPDLREQLKSDPSLVPLFVDEVLRYYTPVAGFWRIARENIELGGVPITKGEVLMVRVDSANRDENQFENPDLFDIHRKNNARHLSFGGGPHTCLGFRLAKQELNIAIPALIDRLKAPELDYEKSDLSIMPAAHARAIRALHLRFTPACAD